MTFSWNLGMCNVACRQMWHDMWCPPWRRCWLALRIMDMEWQLFQPHNNHPWARSSPICFYDLPSMLLDCGALTCKTWKLGGHLDLVAHGNPSERLGASQLSKAYGEERENLPLLQLELASSSAHTSYLERLVPIFTSHMLGTTCQS